jgi:arylsulfatase
MENNKKPNILLIHTDQQRGDCLGVEGHPVLKTPNMDNIAMNGVRFSKFYSPCPSCIATRRSMLLGQSPQKHGIVGYRPGVEIDSSIPTLPGVLHDNGYQTYHVGRSMHQHPPRKLYGFDDMEISSVAKGAFFSEYEEWFEDNCPKGSHNQGAYGVGIMHNDWTARPWHTDEYLHPSNWTVERALRFFKRRDPSKPFFLSLGFIAPHPPLQPPQFYFDRYIRSGVPEPVIGDWASPRKLSPPIDYVSNNRGLVNLSGDENLNYRAAYYGSINHVDDLLRRIFNPVGGNIFNDTIVIFTSDHGEMLGDHYVGGKSCALEASARVPFLVAAPASFGISSGNVCKAPATHADIMPTLLDMLDIVVPDSVDGKSLYPLLKNESSELREYLHIEHSGNHQALTDGQTKYIWSPHEDLELFFDLTKDPNECHNLVGDPTYDKFVEVWRQRLIDELRNRPEGFVKNGKLNSEEFR